MITNYARPTSIPEALQLLEQPDTHPLGGGTWLNQARDGRFAVVDLQDLGLNKIRKNGNHLEIDACVSLQQLLESEDCPESLRQAIRLDAGLNIRNAATVAGKLVSCDGRSAFATVMLALDAKITSTTLTSKLTSSLGDFLPLRPRGLITSISIPLNIRSAFETVGRSPLDKPIVCAALTQWTIGSANRGRTRLALGGTGNSPLLALDGTEPDGIEAAARNAVICSANQGDSDQWASSEYRADVAATLAKRCLETVNK